MSSYSLTKARTFQYVGILLVLAAIATGYWYFFARAGATLNKSSVNSLTSGLVGYWTFDGADISGTTATDRSGSGNNGTLTNGPTKAIGKIGQALNFDGSDDYIGWGAYTTEQTTYTAVLWFKYIDASTTGALFFRGDLNTCAYNPSVLIASGTLNARESGCSGTGIIGSQALTPGWHHVAVTRSGQTAILYFDGVSVATDTSQSTGNFSSGYFSVGASSTNGNPPGFEFFNSSIDDVRVYNRALSAEEVKSLYNLGSADKVNTSAAQPQGSDRLDSGLAGYWKLDENTGTSAGDASTNAITAGTLTNGPTWATGRIGSGVDFDGLNDYTTITDPGTNSALDFSAGETITITAWINPDTLPGGGQIIASKGATTGSNNSNYQFFVSGTGELTLGFNEGSTSWNDYHTGGGLISTGTWQFVVATMTYESGTASGHIYHNGVEQEVFIQANPATNAASVSNDPLWIGAENEAGGAAVDMPFDGKLDEVRIYRRALSADEVADLYRLTTPTGVDTSLKGYWSFNGSDINGTTAYDRSGSGNDGTLTNGPTKAIGKIGQGMNFDFVDDVVTTSQAISGSISATTATLSAWVKPGTQYDTSGVPFNLGCIICDSGGYIGIYRGSYAGIGHDAIVVANYSGSDYFVEANSTAVNTREWAHIVLVHSGGILSAYSNGVFIGSVSSGNTSNLTGSWKIGSTNFNGTIDEVRIYNRALSAGEVKSLYDLGASDKMNTSASQPQGTGRLDSGLAGYWKLDENTGTSAGDASTNGNTGTLTNGPTWTTGQIGSGVTFDGTDDYISVANESGYRFTSDFSLSVWVKVSASLNSYRGIIGKYAVTAAGWDLGVHSNGRSRMTLRGSSNIDTAGAVGPDLRDDTWHHLGLVNTPTGITTYVDGVNYGTTAGTWTPTTNTSFVYIGNRETNVSTTFPGSLDDVRIYSRALSADEVADLYRLTTPTGVDTSLKGYWSFNGSDTSATTAFDRSGSGNDGTLTNGPTRTIGKLGQALQFDGTDDYVSVADNAIFTLDPAQSYAWSVWIKPSVLPANTYQTVWGEDIDINHYFYIYAMTNSDVNWGPITNGIAAGWAGGNTTPLLFQQSNNNVISVGQWAHVVVTYDASLVQASRFKIYVNSVDQTESGDVVSVGTLSTLNPTNIRLGSNSAYGEYFPGTIDDTRLYNRVLSLDEVKALYNQGR